MSHMQKKQHASDISNVAVKLHRGMRHQERAKEGMKRGRACASHGGMRHQSSGKKKCITRHAPREMHNRLQNRFKQARGYFRPLLNHNFEATYTVNCFGSKMDILVFAQVDGFQSTAGTESCGHK